MAEFRLRPFLAQVCRGVAVAVLGLCALLGAPGVLTASADGRGWNDHGSTKYRSSSHGGGFDRWLVIYRDRGFRGASAVISGTADLRQSGFNDAVSSVEVLGGRWEVCSDPGFRGRCEILDFDEPELSRLGLNDRITSIRPVNRRFAGGSDQRFRSKRYGGGLYGERSYGRHVPASVGYGDAPVILFADPDGRGRALPIYGAERNLAPLRFNDVVSSIDVRAGAWLVCSDPDFRGRCDVVDRFEPRTRDFGLNDNISSIRPIRDGYR